MKNNAPHDYKPSKELQELWRVELELSDVLLEICAKNNLKIWAAYGTLIGAARHKGFIPQGPKDRGDRYLFHGTTKSVIINS